MSYEFDARDFDFDASLEEIAIPVKWKGNEYVLKRGSGAVCEQFENARSKTLRYDQQGKIAGFNDPGSLEPLLVSLCLWDESPEAVARGSGGPKQVPIAAVRQFPGPMLSKLFDTAIEISGLRKVSKDRAQLGEVLSRPDAPISFNALRYWIREIDEKGEFKALWDYLKPTEEESAKNERDATHDGSS